MKIAVLGDSHGQTKNIDWAMESIATKGVDYIIHTGDNFDDMRYIVESSDIKTIGVRGNYDTQPEGKDELLEILGEKKLFVTHGHRYGVKYGLEKIFYRGKELEADIVIFGHSHVPHYSIEEEMILLNPGSISIPRGNSSRCYAIIIIDEDVSVEFVEL
ncbi:YfcE family phosphodiesterase [Clostridium formicaceticum]|uniref:Phosphoesterase n=1 Tax=Clostridium formicaceticum TaxID=1497 RepID=A0AAC9RG20_9CLOT|nr:hypothetical protein BJL90_07920 [Clostridium formicaceticum]ARE86166.1 Phosphodiesterase YfcE [Clostridium formicaceticum]